MRYTLFDQEAVAAGASVTATHPVQDDWRAKTWSYYVDSPDASDVDLAWAVRPRNSESFYTVDGAGVASADVTSPTTFLRNVGAAQEIELTVTNNGSAEVSINAGVDRFFRE